MGSVGVMLGAVIVIPLPQLVRFLLQVILVPLDQIVQILRFQDSQPDQEVSNLSIPKHVLPAVIIEYVKSFREGRGLGQRCRRLARRALERGDASGEEAGRSVSVRAAPDAQGAGASPAGACQPFGAWS